MSAGAFPGRPHCKGANEKAALVTRGGFHSTVPGFEPG